MKLIKINEVPEKGVSHNAKLRKRELISCGELGPVTTYSRAVFPPGEKAGAHAHADVAEVFTILSGAGEIRINDVAYVLAAGTTVVVEPGEVHEIINTGTADLVISYFGVLVPFENDSLNRWNVSK
ncbi:cupin domain-containing protein [Pontiella sulfatireligans]|uniref:Oxalate-binding protein n=1 Tax=Pontiella sulfatireligans TaxID=2750658 RepID=A0A6C2UJ96_9BACT|nr:cupin domain-containing protein [Pontiella sulfatireligans]VGO20295.1 Oxalate-binding protein [Pontiella sulfatireligans]